MPLIRQQGVSTVSDSPITMNAKPCAKRRLATDEVGPRSHRPGPVTGPTPRGPVQMSFAQVRHMIVVREAPADASSSTSTPPPLAARVPRLTSTDRIGMLRETAADQRDTEVGCWVLPGDHTSCMEADTPHVGRSRSRRLHPGDAYSHVLGSKGTGWGRTYPWFAGASPGQRRSWFSVAM